MQYDRVSSGDKLMMKKRIKKFVTRRILPVAGFILAIITVLPLPWRIRCAWARMLSSGRNTLFRFYELTSFHKFLEKQNAEFNLGKQESGAYESFNQFESLFEFIDEHNISFNQLRSILESSEDPNIPSEKQRSISDFTENEEVCLDKLRTLLEFAEKT